MTVSYNFAWRNTIVFDQKLSISSYFRFCKPNEIVFSDLTGKCPRKEIIEKVQDLKAKMGKQIDEKLTIFHFHNLVFPSEMRNKLKDKLHRIQMIFLLWELKGKIYKLQR